MEERNVQISETYRSVELLSSPDVRYLDDQLNHGWQLVAIYQSEWPQGNFHYHVYFRRVF